MPLFDASIEELFEAAKSTPVWNPLTPVIGCTLGPYLLDIPPPAGVKNPSPLDISLLAFPLTLILIEDFIHLVL